MVRRLYLLLVALLEREEGAGAANARAMQPLVEVVSSQGRLLGAAQERL
jgi:hypothetical protein